MVDPGPLVTFGRIADSGSGFLFLLLGVLVLFVKPRRAVNFAFSLFTVCFGLSFMLANLPPFQDGYGEARVVIVFLPVAIVGLLWLTRVFPSPLDERGRRIHGWLVAAGLLATAFSLLLAGIESVNGLEHGISLAVRAAFGAFLMMGLGPFLAMLAIRAAAAKTTRERSSCRLASIAFLPYVALASGIYAVMRIAEAHGHPPVFHPYIAVVAVPQLLAITGLWFRAAGRMRGSEARSARRVAIIAPAFAAAGALFASLFGATNEPNNLGALGLARAFGVVVLAYAILNHQLLGIDVKLRVAIKGSTLAAIFIGVFFVVSEIAQQFFGARYQNQYLGIAAAGGLVFAMAPLQRIAERVAHKAVPTLEPLPLQAGAPPTVVDADFRAAFIAAMSDGRITEREEMALARLADRLHVPAATLVEMRQAATVRRRR